MIPYKTVGYIIECDNQLKLLEALYFFSLIFISLYQNQVHRFSQINSNRPAKIFCEHGGFQ